MDKSGADVAIEGAILSEMLEIVAKRAALRPSDANTIDTSRPPVSLPILPPSTTQNPLQQYNTANNYNNNTNMPSISSTTSSSTLTNRYMKQHSYQGSGFGSRQRQKQQNEDVSEFSSVLSSTYSLMHDYYELLEKCNKQKQQNKSHFPDTTNINSCTIFAHTVLVLFEFIFLYACVLYYGFLSLEK